MKNIHLIPTDKPSRLLMSKRNNLQFLKDNSSLNPNNHFEGTYKNIYITSDKSPNINGYYLLNDNVVCKKDETYFATSWKEREIILTTNIELIADGVQAIDDEFLEWFVKNPSCEWVEVQEFYGFSEDYLIIIPKEEPKQETLEEAAERLAYDSTEENKGFPSIKKFIQGAKFQAERMYSEEDLREAFRQGMENMDYSEIYGLDSELTEQDWFEQFKKK